MDYFKVVVLELFMPSSHPSCQFTRRLPVYKVLIVHFDDEGVLSPDQVQSPVVNCFHDSKELQIMGIVILLC